MIVVDTSVWIAFFRDAEHPAARRLGQLLQDDAVAISVVVRLELLAGAKKQQQRHLADLLSAVPTHVPDDDSWALLETWTLTAKQRGHAFGVGDLLVAAAADAYRSPVWSLDSDFERMARIGFIAVDG